MHTTSQPVIDCRITSEPIQTPDLRRNLPTLGDCGGYVCFEGLIRDNNLGRQVTRLAYEVYEPLALAELRRICTEAAERFHLRLVQAVHRHGDLGIGDTAVVVQVLAGHRGPAFDGCRFVIDQLKVRVPIWKKEYYADGTTAWTRCHEHHEHAGGGHHCHGGHRHAEPEISL